MQKENLFRSLNWLALAGILVLIILSVTMYKSWKGINNSNYQTITVTGEGMVYVTPDVATFDFTINEVKSTVKEAQATVNNKMIAVKKSLTDLKIADVDVKSTYYTVIPKYTYSTCMPTISYIPCVSKQKLEGYEVSHNVSVKVRDLDNAGKVLEALGSAAVNNISGPNFVVDDMTKPKEEAKNKAILEAKAKAKVLEGQLGIDLDGIVSYSEQDNNIYPYTKDSNMGYRSEAVSTSVPTPMNISAGQNKVTSTVSITYKMK